MFVATYDDRLTLPEYMPAFVHNTTKFCDLYFLSPSQNWSSLGKSSTKFSVKQIIPDSLPQFIHTKRLFDSVFVNYSTLPDNFERACFHRWFALNAATTHLRPTDFICLLDSDFLIGMSPSDVLHEVLTRADGRDIEFISEWNADENVAISPEITILTKQYLFSFCKYILTSYYDQACRGKLTGEYFDRIGNGLPGGICDMRALASFMQTRAENSFNLRALPEPFIIGNFNGFLNDEGKANDWSIVFASSSQKLCRGSRERRLVGTHFQGSAKTYMPLVTGGPFVLTRELCMQHLELVRLSSTKARKSLITRAINRLKQISNRGS